jgi:hypothetical protein
VSQTISAEKVTLYDLMQRFGLQRVEDTKFSRMVRTLARTDGCRKAAARAG